MIYKIFYVEIEHPFLRRFVQLLHFVLAAPWFIVWWGWERYFEMVRFFVVSAHTFELDYKAILTPLQIKGVVHVGANVGQEAAVYDELGVPKVLWIEAQEDCRGALEGALKKHHRDEDVVAITAVSGEEGSATLFQMDNSISSSLKPLGSGHKHFFPFIQQAKTQQLQTETLDGLLKRLSLNPREFDFMYLDVQGSELDVLKGSTTQVLPHIRYLVTEVSAEEHYKGGREVAKVTNGFMDEIGIKCEPLAMAQEADGEKLGERSGSSVLIEMKRGELSISVERKDMLSPPSTKVRTSLKTSIHRVPPEKDRVRPEKQFSGSIGSDMQLPATRSSSGPNLRNLSGPLTPAGRSTSLRVPAGTPANAPSTPLTLPEGALATSNGAPVTASPTSQSGRAFTPVTPNARAQMVASLQNGSLPFGSEELTFGVWRRDVADLHMLFQEKNVEEETVRNLGEPVFSSVSFLLPTASATEEDSTACCKGIAHYRPQTYDWLTGRMSTSRKHVLVFFFMVLEGIRLILAKRAFIPGINMLSILVVENLSSFVLACVITLIMEGSGIIKEMLSWSQLWRFMISALMFTAGSGLVLAAYCVGTSPVEVVTFGYSYMPICAVLSYFAFNRRYGRLEWLSVGMLTLGVLAFVLLREESREGKELKFQMKGLLLVVASVVCSATGSILAERVFKERSFGDAKQDRFYIMKFHLDLTALFTAALLWSLPLNRLVVVRDFMLRWERSEDWFGNWGTSQCLMVLVMVAHGWAAGLITREFSTVIRSIVQTLALLSSWLIGDPLQDNRLNFLQRCVPSWLLYLIVIMAALIFQTGRVNLKVIRKACDLSTEAETLTERG
ncbi:unnamed protein product [Durusdinium trenchii]|uniref:Methyltransferase FkbM domain-containing protein n=1 Tax=Durusdinium trenchii TaxID=1381693 RepID=A0ABP0SA40_9DINO